MNKKDRLNKAVNYLIFKGTIKEKKDIAPLMDVNNSNVSSALNGNDRYLTDRFLKKFSKTFSFISATWLVTGEGEMLVSSPEKDNESEEPGATYTTAKEKQLQNRIKQLEDQLVYERQRNLEFIETERRLNDLEDKYQDLQKTLRNLSNDKIDELIKYIDESIKVNSK